MENKNSAKFHSPWLIIPLGIGTDYTRYGSKFP